jgi:hypothetical protein
MATASRVMAPKTWLQENIDEGIRHGCAVFLSLLGGFVLLCIGITLTFTACAYILPSTRPSHESSNRSLDFDHMRLNARRLRNAVDEYDKRMAANTITIGTTTIQSRSAASVLVELFEILILRYTLEETPWYKGNTKSRRREITDLERTLTNLYALLDPQILHAFCKLHDDGDNSKEAFAHLANDLDTCDLSKNGYAVPETALSPTMAP